MKTDSIFAVFNAKNTNTRLFKVGNNHAHTSASYRKDTGCCFPLDAHFKECVLVLGGTGGSSLSVIMLLNFFPMPRTGEIKVSANNSSRHFASAREKGTSYADVRLSCNNPHSIACFSDIVSEARRRFKAEMKAKNDAYDFIIYAGLTEAFGRWLAARHRPGRKPRTFIDLPQPLDKPEP